MAAFQRLLLRGLLAGRRVATAPTLAPRAFSTTTISGSSHVPQSHGPSLERVTQECLRVEHRNIYILPLFTVLVLIGYPVSRIWLAPPHPPSKSEGKS